MATLGYSRASFVEFTTDETTQTLCRALRTAFDYFGGVPAEVLFDNAKSVVLERDAYGAGLHRWNPELLALAEECGFTPRLCRPYRAKTKGKVERFNGYLKGSFLVPLAASLKASGLMLTAEVANRHVPAARRGPGRRGARRAARPARAARSGSAQYRHGPQCGFVWDFILVAPSASCEATRMIAHAGRRSRHFSSRVQQTPGHRLGGRLL